jgi:putative component of membrane protein insertase Oxa1/YidC/SpoIIIJ protein YidD
MIIQFCIRVYQYFFSPDKGIFSLGRRTCAMHPTCSEYMEQSIEKYGFIKGFYRGLRRIGKCHPWQKNLIDLP